jgi:hypothetical protein
MIPSKEILFFVVVFILFFIFVRGGCLTAERLKFNPIIGLISTSALYTLSIVLVYYLSVRRIWKDGFTFEVTPAKLCAGGPYMYSSNPQLKKLCSHITNQEIAQVACGPGFHGRPVHWERSTMSNDKWENNMCKNPGSWNANSPCVL